MQKPPISVLVMYSNLDAKFLDAILIQCSKFSDDIVVASYDKLFNGDVQDLDFAKQICSKYSNVRFEEIKLPIWELSQNYYPTLIRAYTTHFAKHQHLLFLDADEIPDDNFKLWLDTDWNSDNIYWFTSYWYFREPVFRSKTTEAAGLLINKKDCQWDTTINVDRQQMLYVHPIKKSGNWYRPNVIDGSHHTSILKNGFPLIHHFSWVRNKEEMLNKVKNWGHREDRNWVELVEEEFSKPFSGKDFVHGYEYDVVDNIFNIKL